jgi:hypothetical protein
MKSAGAMNYGRNGGRNKLESMKNMTVTTVTGATNIAMNTIIEGTMGQDVNQAHTGDTGIDPCHHHAAKLAQSVKKKIGKCMATMHLRSLTKTRF